MGITERKEREKQEMRKNIIDAAMHMFMHEGYEDASIRKIADKIEYSPATIYLYYKDKDELLYDVQAECFSRLVEVFKERTTAADPFERLIQFGEAYMDFGLQNPQVYELMFIMKAPMKTVEACEMWKNGDDAFALLVQCMAECMEMGRVKFNDVLQGVLSVWAMSHGLISLEVCYRMKVMNLTEEQVKAALYSSLHHYLDTIKK